MGSRERQLNQREDRDFCFQMAIRRSSRLFHEFEDSARRFHESMEAVSSAMIRSLEPPNAHKDQHG